MSPPLKFTVNVVSGQTDIIELRNTRGSIQHYYHFLLGGLLPFVNHIVQNGEKKSYCIKTDVGPMQRILDEIPVHLVSEWGIPTHYLKGFDCYLDQDLQAGGLNEMTTEIRARIIDWFERSSPTEVKALNYPKTVLIQRAREPFFDTDRAEIKTSGSDRRSITNHNELTTALDAKFGKAFQNVILEKESIYFQYQLFSRADLVIAQHGACLANMFFMSPGSQVIEIAPPWCQRLNVFGNLARQCEIKYVQVEQDANHSPVDVEAIMRVIG